MWISPAHLRGAVHCQEALPDAGTVCAKNGLCRQVDAEHAALPIQDHQALAHVAGNLLEFICLGPQLPELIADLSALLMDTAQKGSQFLISLVLQGAVQIQSIEGAYDLLCHPVG